MKYQQPFNESNPDAPYVDGNPVAGIEGSIPRGAAIEHPQREIMAVIQAAGLAPYADDLTQLLQAIRIIIDLKIDGAFSNVEFNNNVVTLITDNYAKGSLIATKLFTTPGTYTYTPSDKTREVHVMVHGGGGGGGGVDPTDGTQFGWGGGGGGGGAARSILTSGFAGQIITVGGGGGGGVNPISSPPYSRDGQTGGTSSFGSILSATGGGGARGGSAGTGANVQAGGGGGRGFGGNQYPLVGFPGNYGTGFLAENSCAGYGGGSPVFGGGGDPVYSGGGDGRDSVTFGGGGGGASSGYNAPARRGGNGSNGIVIVEEYA